MLPAPGFKTTEKENLATWHYRNGFPAPPKKQKPRLPAGPQGLPMMFLRLESASAIIPLPEQFANDPGRLTGIDFCSWRSRLQPALCPHQDGFFQSDRPTPLRQ